MKPILTTLRNECRFPLTIAEPGSPEMFCAKQTKEKSSYCAEHHEVVHRPSKKKEKV